MRQNKDLPLCLPSFRPAALVTREQAPLFVSTKDPEFNEWSAPPYTFVGNYHPMVKLQLCLHLTVPRRVSSACSQTRRASSLACRELHVLHANLTMPCCVSFQGGLLLKLWQKAMSTEAGRKMGRNLLEKLVSSQKLQLLDLVELFGRR